MQLKIKYITLLLFTTCFVFADYPPSENKVDCCIEINASLQEQNKLLLSYLGKKDTCCQTIIIKQECCQEEKEDNNNWLIGVLAVVGTLAASFVAAYISKRNTDQTLNANKEIEIEKKKAEVEYNLKLYLQENIGKFVNKATKLNGAINTILYKEYEEHGILELAWESYDKTLEIRNELKDIFYSVRVSLDGSKKQKELEDLLVSYMNVTCFNFDPDTTKSDDYSQPLAKIFHKARSIIHENYPEPQ